MYKYTVKTDFSRSELAINKAYSDSKKLLFNFTKLFKPFYTVNILNSVIVF